MEASVELAPSTAFGDLLAALPGISTYRRTGRVRELAGLLISADGPAMPVGELCEIETSAGRSARAQVVGFREGRVLLMALEEAYGIEEGNQVVARPGEASVSVGSELMGRVLDGFGRPADGLPPIRAEEAYDIYAAPPGAMEREPIAEPLISGIRAIDSFLTMGLGQRIGIFGGSGVGKSTLLGSMARNNSADVTVIALIGERNREVRDFLEHELGPEGRARSVVVVATSDTPAPLRVRACFTSMAIAEYFRDQGKRVLLVMDSVTRFAMAQREIGLAAGEPPGQKGYPPSVFQLLPKIFERAGNFQQGSITGFFTVLVEGDDMNEPITDAVRSILDGHIVLSREMGARGHYPAIDILNSVSRLASRVADPAQRDAASKLRGLLSSYQQSEDLINLGAYVGGSNAAIDASIKLRPKLMDFLKQRPDEHEEPEAALGRLCTLASEV